MSNDTPTPSSLTSARRPQARGPLPLAFRRRNGRITLQTYADYSTRQSSKSGTTGRNGFTWPRVEREKPYPEATVSSKQVGNVLATVITTADGTPYAAMQSGAVRRLEHTDDGLRVYRRKTKAERKAAKRAKVR